MPLALWFGSVFISIVGYLAKYLTKRIAVIGAVIATFILIISSFRGAIEAGIAAIYVSVPTGAFAFGLGLLPDNSALCISTLMTAQTASLLFRFQSKMLEFKLKAI